MTVVARPFESEPDLLIGHEFDSLIVTDLDKNQVDKVQPPIGGWTHDSLEAYESEHLYAKPQSGIEGWDLYLGALENWIGGSEV